MVERNTEQTRPTVIIVQTPLRISFLGGGSDFKDFYARHGGAVLSTAIDKSVFVIVKERFDDMIYINYSKKEIVESVDDIQHGLVREAMRLTGVDHGVEITTLSDVPADGVGLGSSSSITVGLLQALYAHKRVTAEPEKLAQEACHIEIDLLGKPIGVQDQYIAAYGGLRHMAFGDEGVYVNEAGLNGDIVRGLQERLLVFYTGITRQAETVLIEQQANISSRTVALSEMSGLVQQGIDVLLEGDYDGFGRLLDRNWYLKKQLASKVTIGEIDEMYHEALSLGALGGKLLGAGGGGFLLLYSPVQWKDRIRKAMANRGLQEFRFAFSREGSEVILRYRR